MTQENQTFKLLNLIFSKVAELNSCVDSHAVRTGLFVNGRVDLIIVIIIRLISSF